VEPTTSPSTQPQTQQLCLRETDPVSPRKSKLASDKPTDEIIRLSVQGTDRPDVLERWWKGHRCRWIDENGDMKSNDQRGDLSGDSLQIDMDNDGFYDGPSDWNIKWVDDDGDGVADAQIVAINPTLDQKSIHANTSHYMVFIDVDHDGVNGFIDWADPDWVTAKKGNWRMTGAANYSPDYNGNSIFLKQHDPAWVLTDPRFNWENPFAFYDFDKDGCTEMTVRMLDNTTGSNPSRTYTAEVHECFVSLDLDNDSQKGNEFDLDLSLRFAPLASPSRLRYSQYRNRHNIRAPQWVLDAKLFRYDNYRRIDEWCYVPFEKCFDEAMTTKWGECWLVFDEDDDDHRWERVEMYYPNRDVYSTKRFREVKERSQASTAGHVQADSLGDRGEWDKDNSGGGKLYVGAWDGKLHLFGAENGAWLVDEHAKYWGAGPVVPAGSSKERAAKVEEVVQYRDTDNNGFFDEITFDYDGDKTVDLKISLLEYRDAAHPDPDEQPLYDPAKLKWQGMHDLYTSTSEQSFHEAQLLYRAMWKANLTTPEMDELAIASSTGEKYDHAYWMKQKIFRLLDDRLKKEPAQQARLRRSFFMNDLNDVADLIGERR
jgi:hypothetical protein